MIEISRNNEYTRIFNVTNPDGSPKQLGSVVEGWYTLARSNAATDAYLQIPLTDSRFNITDPAGGIVEINLETADTEALPIRSGVYEELHLVDSTGVGQTVFTGEARIVDTIATAV